MYMPYARVGNRLRANLLTNYAAKSFLDYGGRKGKDNEILLLYELYQLAPVESK